jgi:hypothetical protein
MRQTAPDPRPLHALVNALDYKPGWTFTLEDIDRGQGSAGLTLSILIRCPDTYEPDKIRPVVHYMLVPPAAYNERSWRRWLFDQIMLVERHEAMEWFKISGHRPYAPLHSPGNDPYLIAEMSTDEERRTTFRGVLDPGRP